MPVSAYDPRKVCRRFFAVWLLRVAVAWSSLAAVSGCSRPVSTGLARPNRLPRGSVLLITIDTLRRDRVGAFGGRGGLTPTLDGLAESGIRYERTYSHVPMTLAAHTSILTGLTPRRTGVHTNTLTRLDSSIDTLATVLKAEGYHTAAFVGAFVLDARFGLARGFDVYDDHIPPAQSASFHVAERGALEVVKLAGDWILAQQKAGPWFSWIHLFDPHAPYAASVECRSEGRSAYDAEVACTDRAIGGLLNRLRAAHALDRTLIVVTADHGESLGEHGETTHGLFAYNATLAVPLIIAGAGAGRVDVAVAHADIMPTILEVVGAAPRPNLDGRSLTGALAADRPIYFESLDAYLTRGWAPLRGVIQGLVKYVDLPQDELYELDVDPGEEHNRVAQDPRAAAMRTALRTLSSAPEPQATAAPVDAEAASRLRSLGYVGRAVPLNARPSAEDDPKRLVALNERFNSALTAFDERRADVALAEFVAILRERPDFLTARTSAATVLLNMGRGNDAVRLLEEAPLSQHASAEWSIRLGAALRELGQMREAAAVLEAARTAGADDAELTQNLATVYAAQGRTKEARALFSSLASAEGAPATAWYNVGLVELQSGRKQEAAAAFRRAVERDPAYGDAWNGLGASLVERDAAAAIDAWRNAEKLLPRDYDLLFNLAMLTADLRSPSEAAPYLRRFAAEAPRPRYERDIARVEQRLKAIESRSK
jgi:tetratricopeptide (TPR) repeat protein